MKRPSLILILLSATLSACSPEPQQATAPVLPPSCTQLHPYGLPATLKPLKRNCDTGFESFIWEEGKIPLITVEFLKPENLIGTNPVTAPIIQDFTHPEITPKPEAYTGIPYAPGKLVAPENHRNNLRAIKSAFQTSNIVPMDNNLSRSTWLQLETGIHKCMKDSAGMTVVTGALPSEQFTSTKLNIPLAFYKVLINANAYRAFIIDNQPQPPVGPLLTRYEVSLTTLERRGAKIAPKWTVEDRSKPGSLCSGTL